MRRALILSLAVHVGLLGAIALGSLRARSFPEPTIVAVELVAGPETGANQRAAAPQAATAPLPPREAASPNPAPRSEPEAGAPPPPPEPAPRPPMRPQAEPEPARAAPPPPPEPAPRPEPPKEPPRPAEKPRPNEAKPVDTKLAEAERKPPAKLEPPRPAPRVEPAKPEAVKPEPAKPEPPKPAAKVEPAKPEPKPAPPRPSAEAEDSFAALLKSVERLERRVRAEQTTPGQGRSEVRLPEARGTTPRAAEEGLSQSEIDAIRRQIERCWNVPVGVRGIETMQVRLRIVLNRDGSVARVGIEDQARMAVDPAFRVVAESAQRAVLSCHLTLPPEKYELWREMVMTFYPGDALRG